uniref:Interleukin-22 receptor subunit alpha-1 isoform X1 n=1 Tax=Pogona vitticeps TaxID=103695 RepID=A0A6J0U4Y4_9SAUR
MKEHLIFWVFCSLVGNSLTERRPFVLQATFLSTNFENIFTWESRGETPPGTVYYVQYKRYGEEWQDKIGCQNITQRFCNLTQETENFTERFHARVRAVVQNCCASMWVQSLRFCPREDTTMGKPEVKCIPNTQSIKFFIHPPYTPLKDEDNQPLTVVDIFSQFGDVTYEITMFCPKTQQKWIKTLSTQEFEISDLDPDTEYNGTVCIKYADKVSKPYVFRVRTSPDRTWLPYLFTVILFMIILIFGTIYYLIYKYIKQYDAEQPTALDFKNLSRFQPLVPKAEHFLIPCDVSKSVQHILEMQPAAQINPQPLGHQEHRKLFSGTETAYQQQATVPPFPTFAQTVAETEDLPRGYAPQATKNNPPSPLESNPLTLTYGLCVEGTSCIDKAGSSPNQAGKRNSFPEDSVNNGPYQAQKPEHSRGGAWVNQAQQEFTVDHAGKKQCLMLQEDTRRLLPQLLSSLEEKACDTAVDSTGSYRKQPKELLPLALTQNAILESNPLLLGGPPSLISHGAPNKLCQDHSAMQWTGWDSLAWTDNQWAPFRCPTKDCITPASKGLTREDEPFGATPENPLDSSPNKGLFTDLFKDLELKIQWNYGTEGSGPVY